VEQQRAAFTPTVAPPPLGEVLQVTAKAEGAADKVAEQSADISITKLRLAMRPVVRQVFDYVRAQRRFEGGRHRLKQALCIGKNGGTRALKLHVRAGALRCDRKGGPRQTSVYWPVNDFDRAHALAVYEADRASVAEQFTKYKRRPRRATGGKEPV